jgi:hypothetical protein
MTTALMIEWNNGPTFPTTTETIPTIIPNPDNIKVNFQTHLRPFQSRYAMTRYAIPIITRIPPIIILLCNEKRTRIFVKSLVLAFLGGVLIH